MHCFEPGSSTEWVFWVSNQIPLDSSKIDDIGICKGVCLKISHPGTQNPDKSSFYQSGDAANHILTEFNDKNGNTNHPVLTSMTSHLM